MDEKDEFLRTPPYLYGQMALATPDLPGIGGMNRWARGNIFLSRCRSAR